MLKVIKTWEVHIQPEERPTSHWANYIIPSVQLNPVAVALLFQPWAYSKQQMPIVQKKPKLDQTQKVCLSLFLRQLWKETDCCWCNQITITLTALFPPTRLDAIPASTPWLLSQADSRLRQGLHPVLCPYTGRANMAPLQLTEPVPLTAGVETTEVPTGLTALGPLFQLFGKLQVLGNTESMRDTAHTTGATTGSPG